MLKPEQAQKELEKIKIESWQKSRLAALKELPPNLRKVARPLVGIEDDGEDMEYEKHSKLREEIRPLAAGMTKEQRLELFEALFPRLGQAVEGGWQILDHLPHEIGSEVKSFRFPGNERVLLKQRLEWVESLLNRVGEYPPQNLAWHAAWAGHNWNSDTVSILLAAAIDAGGKTGQEIFEILCASASGEHEIGIMGRHVTRTFLCSSRPECWEFIEKMLLAAQREEGLRQTILESIDAAHPEAFRRMLRLILDKNLVRFSATVRALNVWVGYQWDSVSTGVVNKVIERLLLYLEDSQARSAALKGKDPEQAYLALWAIAFDNAMAALEPAATLLKYPKAEFRFAAAYLLAQIPTPEAQQKLFSVLEDKDLHLPFCALQGHRHGDLDEELLGTDLFDRLEKLLPAFPARKTKLPPLIWPWTGYVVDRELVSSVMVRALGDRPATRLIPHLPLLTPYERSTALLRMAQAPSSAATRIAGILGQVVTQLADVPSHLARVLVKSAGLSSLAPSEPAKPGAAERDAFLAWIGDSSRNVREAALKGLEQCDLDPADAPKLEGLLTRTAGDLRRGVLGVLLKQADAEALESAGRLLAAGSAPQRLAGLELLRQLADAKRCLLETRERAAAYRKTHPKLAEAERQQIENIETARAETLTLDNALGLLNPEERTWPEKPVHRKVALHSAAATRLIKALDDLVHDHRETSITLDRTDEQKQMLLGEVHYGFPDPKFDLSPADDLARLPLAEVWEGFWQKRGKELSDADGFELLRAKVWFECANLDPYTVEDEVFIKRCKAAMKALVGDYSVPKLRYPKVTEALLNWLHRLHPPAGAEDFLLDAVETVFALVPDSELRHVIKEDDYDDAHWRDSNSPFMRWYELLSWHRRFIAPAPSPRGEGRGEGDRDVRQPTIPEKKNSGVQQSQSSHNTWKPEHAVRLWKLMRWRDQPLGKAEHASLAAKSIARIRAELEEILAAHKAGGATDADVLDQLLGPREEGRYGSSSFSELLSLTIAGGRDLRKQFPAVVPLLERARARVLEIELTRGDTPTPASKAALDIKRVYGIPSLISFLRAMGDRNFVRGHSFSRDNDSKETVFSHLARCCLPAEGETFEDFKRQTAAAQISEQRLIELALYAPQWAPHVQHALSWKSLVDAVGWIHAHTKGTDWSVPQELRDSWKAELSQLTTLSSEDLLEGGVDVAWFKRVYADLGDKRWSMLDDAAKYASTGIGHARARLFADAMLGRAKKKELLQRINPKRQQDAVRALGLLPLAEGKSRETDLLERYKLMQEFIRTSRQFGSQRQASEKRAAQIGQENLARTAGYPDPVRLQWAMEARAVADLSDGPINVTVEGVTVSLAIDPWGDIQFTVTKEGKPLADIPPKLKKDKKIAALRERKTELKRQASRIRSALEQFMCRGETVTGAELQDLMKHPLLAPMLSGLVLVGDGVLGYPVNGGKVLEDYAGDKEALKKDEQVRIAHPLDLLPAAKWHQWQKDCFAKERIQPFKQVFREVYTLTKPEKDEGTQSRRYAGHQVQPRKAMALLGSRGWVHHPEQGVRKTSHDAGVTVWLEFDEPFFTPAEVEGLTLESVHFTKRSDGKPLKLTDLPPRLFSETMRDLDLVVSVAHRGGVDPEASASTLEMRAALVQETCALLKLSNVRVKDSRALIKGDLGDYSVHLGSAITRKIPGETLFIVAVHSQHRGRLFLPFADDDPRTAEVISKVLLLARDKEIKDPSIIEQIRLR